VQVNIEIMRAFVRLRQVLAVNTELARRVDEVEKHLGQHDAQFIEVIRAIRQLMEPPSRPPRRRIGFQVQHDELSSQAKARGRN
jgi:GAF domain-containing protein